MNLYKVETGSVYGLVYVVAQDFIGAAKLVLDSGRKIERIEIVPSGALLIADENDHGEEALYDELLDRMQQALEYIDVMWNHQPTDRSAYRADLSNLTAILEGNQEAGR